MGCSFGIENFTGTVACTQSHGQFEHGGLPTSSGPVFRRCRHLHRGAKSPFVCVCVCVRACQVDFTIFAVLAGFESRQKEPEGVLSSRAGTSTARSVFIHLLRDKMLIKLQAILTMQLPISRHCWLWSRAIRLVGWWAVCMTSLCLFILRRRLRKHSLRQKKANLCNTRKTGLVVCLLRLRVNSLNHSILQHGI